VPLPLPPATAGECIIIAGESTAVASPPAFLFLTRLERPLPLDFRALRLRRTVPRQVLTHPSRHLIGAGVQLLLEGQFSRAAGRGFPSLVDVTSGLVTLPAERAPSVSPRLARYSRGQSGRPLEPG